MCEPPLIFHPLGGCDLGNLIAHLEMNREYSRRSRAQRIRSILAVITDTIIALLEARVTRWTERRSGVGVVASIVGRT